MKLLEALTINNLSDILKTLENNGVSLRKLDEYDQFRKLGNGSYASVYEIEDTEFVLRIGVSRTESDDNMEELINKDFDNVVKVYLYKNIKNGASVDNELVVMEQLYNLEEEEHGFYHALLSLMDYLSIEELITVTDFDDKDDIRNTLLHYIFEEDEELELGEEINIIDSAIDEIYYYREFFHQIYNGFMELKSVGIYHNDLHPQNIMVDKKGTIKIIDWF
jgi:serine/threonine protein kinase